MSDSDIESDTYTAFVVIVLVIIALLIWAAPDLGHSMGWW